MLEKIAFSGRIKNEERYTVYIMEGGIHTPFLAIEGDYGGNVLLLRKYLLDGTIQYNPLRPSGSRNGYYPGSNVDEFLSTDYLSRFSQEIQDKIIDSTISVTRRESAWGGDKSTEDIQRKIFLLSATELTIESRIRSIEGLPLAYFNARMKLPVGSRFLQTYEDGTTGSYWLRSTYLADDVQASVVWGSGRYGGAGASNSYITVQPAFCLSKDTRLVKTELHGKHVYVVCEEIDSH